MLQLYTFFRSSTSFRLRIALAWKGLPYEPHYTSLPKMAHRAEDYLKLNPQGLVPALVDEAGRVFTQSMAMIEYLDERHPAPPLMPSGAEARWYVRAASQIIGCEIHPLNNVRVLKYLKSAFSLEDAQINGQWYSHWISEGLRGFEAFLQAEGRHGRYCLGDQFSMADVCLVPQIYNARRFGCDLSGFPLTLRITEACLALDAVKSADPGGQADAF
jgi:maleylacetoacetate isomerase/maleylpyruvate isomerase